jgi:hypothetical protein
MKHFIKKFKYEIDINEPNALSEAVAILDTSSKPKINLEFLKKKNIKARINIDNKVHIDAFPQKIKESLLLMPLPDITLVYLDQSYNLNYNFNKLEIENNLIRDLNTLTNSYNLNETIRNSIYAYIGYKSTIITTLISALESFFNQLIERQIGRIITLGKKEYIVNYKLNFEEKIKYVIPHITNKKYDLSNNLLLELNGLRNDIIHLKYGEKGLVNSSLIDRMIRFDFKKNYSEVVKYFNYYKPEYVQECRCTSEY